MKFLIQLVVLFIFASTVANVFASQIQEIMQTAIGWALLTTTWIAIGWYWSRICNYVIEKARSLTQK